MSRTRNIKGKDYQLVVLHVLERDAEGRPSKVTVGYDDTTFKVAGGEQFLTAYVSVEGCEPDQAKKWLH